MKGGFSKTHRPRRARDASPRIPVPGAAAQSCRTTVNNELSTFGSPGFKAPIDAPSPIRTTMRTSSWIRRDTNRRDVARRRQQWIAYQDRIDPARLVFIDETWTKTSMPPLRGWAPRGRRLPASRNYFDQLESPAATPSRRHSSAMLGSPRRLSSTIRIFSSAA
jgi:hypothetical protein